MTERNRPWLITVWERGFATEDEADEAYEQFLEVAQAPLEVDRLDAHTVRFYLDTKALESRAQIIEAEYEPTTVMTVCQCGHVAAAHRGEDTSCEAHACKCRSFERNGKTN